LSGPRKETLQDFWKMVWSEKIDRMVMITLTMENGKARKLRDMRYAYSNVTVIRSLLYSFHQNSFRMQLKLELKSLNARLSNFNHRFILSHLHYS